jgi:hypothetical protein
MSAEIESFIEYCFEQWANIYGGRIEGGFPARSVEGRLKDDGGILPSTRIYSMPENVFADEAECWLILMRSYKRKIYDVMTRYYLYSKYSKNAVTRIRNELNISQAQIYKMLSEGLCFISGIIVAPDLKSTYNPLKNYLNLYKKCG